MIDKLRTKKNVRLALVLGLFAILVAIMSIRFWKQLFSAIGSLTQ